MKKKLLYILAGVLGLTACLWIFRFSIMGLFLNTTLETHKQNYLSNSPEKIILKSWDKFEEDYKLIKKIDFFNQTPGSLNDAGPFLNPMISWSNIKDNNENDPLYINPTLKDKIRAFNSDKNVKFDLNELNLNFAWFKELHKYDHWNYEFHNPINAQTNDYRFYTFPMPNYSDLIIWSKARIFKGVKDKNLKDAIKENHDLARLIFLNEDLVSMMVAISLLKNETMIVQSMAPTYLNKTDVIPTETLNVALRFLRAQTSFLDLRLSQETFIKLLKFDTGLCQKIFQAMNESKAFYKILKTDMPGSFERIDKLVEDTDSKCRNSFVRQKWKDPDYQALFKQNDDIFQMANSFNDKQIKSQLPFKYTVNDLEKNPKLAKTIMYMIISIGSPNYINSYYFKD